MKAVVIACIAGMLSCWCMFRARSVPCGRSELLSMPAVSGAVPRRWAASRRCWSSVIQALRRRRERSRYVEGLPELLDVIVRQLRSGASLLEALRIAGSGRESMLSRDVDTTVKSVDRGQELSDAVEAWRRRCSGYDGIESLDVVCALLVLTHNAGGASATAFDGVAATLRSRRDVRREARALASQATASSLLMVVAPLVYVAFGVVTHNSSAAFLFGTPVGWACLAAGLALDAGSTFWMLRIIRSVV